VWWVERANTVSVAGDLTAEALEAELPGRPLQAYPALLSTAVAAGAWAQSGAPDGAVVVADYQVSPRGHADRPWRVAAGRGLGLSLVLRPRLATEREGWLYVVAAAALADVCGEGATIEWPDEIRRGEAMTAALGVQSRLGPEGVKWAVVSALLPEAEPPRGRLLGSVIQAIEARLGGDQGAVLEDYDRRCATLGRHVRARLLGGTGPRMEGRALGALDNGSLLLEKPDGRRASVRPQDVRGLEEA
jgi:BirA family transcriptional regulator, biotin operon repressor / biotin---[acetyl-CoA-carboxylase] ligase